MTITFNNTRVFCANCGSFDLTFVEDELLTKSAGSGYKKVVRCLRCRQYFSKEYIESFLEDFTDLRRLREIKRKRAKLFEHYKSFRTKVQEPKTKVRKKVKDKKIGEQKRLV